MESAKEKLAEKLAAERIHRAMEKIERAQNLLNEAASELCPIVGMCGRWERISKSSALCRASWQSLNIAAQHPYRVDATCLEAHLQAASRPAYRSPEQADG